VFLCSFAYFAVIDLPFNFALFAEYRPYTSFHSGFFAKAGMERSAMTERTVNFSWQISKSFFNRKTAKNVKKCPFSTFPVYNCGTVDAVIE